MAKEELKKLTLEELLNHTEKIIRLMSEAVLSELKNIERRKTEKEDWDRKHPH